MKLKELKERYPSSYIEYIADSKRHRIQDSEADKIYNFLDRKGYSILVNTVTYENGSRDRYYPILKHNGKIKEFNAYLTSYDEARKYGIEFALNYKEREWYE